MLKWQRAAELKAIRRVLVDEQHLRQIGPRSERASLGIAGTPKQRSLGGARDEGRYAVWQLRLATKVERNYAPLAAAKLVSGTRRAAMEIAGTSRDPDPTVVTAHLRSAHDAQTILRTDPPLQRRYVRFMVNMVYGERLILGGVRDGRQSG